MSFGPPICQALARTIFLGFQEDTFATDSLSHILSLLSSLDTHAFSLLASISLTNRSRVKDLWIFTGPAPATSEPEEISARESSSSVIPATSELRRAGQSGNPESPKYTSSPTELGVGGTSQHRRYATAPAGSGLPNFPEARDALHPAARAATENASHSRPPPSPITQTGGFNRQATTRTNLPAPLAVKPPNYRDNKEGGRRDQERAAPPSATPSGMENTTSPGGTVRERQASERGGGVIYATGKNSSPVLPRNPAGRSRSPSPPPRQTSSPRPQSPLRSSSSPKQSAIPSSDKSPTPPLLGVGVFAVGSTYRNSELSSNTEADVKSCEIPIAWTGNEEGRRVQDLPTIAENPKTPKADRLSIGPMLPGGWQSTPEEEKPAEVVSIGQDAVAKASPTPNTVDAALQDVDAHVASPELMVADEKARKSQVGSVGVIPAPGPPPPLPSPEKDSTTAEQKEDGENSNQGWVLINVEAKEHKRGKSSGSGPPTEMVTVPTPKSNEAALDATVTPETSKEGTLSSAAKAIVMADAVEAKKEKAKSPGLKRFFTKNKTRKLSTDDEKPNLVPPNSPIGASNGTAPSGDKEKALPKRPEGHRKLRRGSTH